MAAKNSILLFCVVFLVARSLGQKETVDSLLKVLSSSRGTVKVDCLNALSETLIGLPDWFDPTPPKPQLDSAEIFNRQALAEAQRINYTYGIARAISLEAELVFEKYGGFAGAEKLSRQAINEYNKTTNKKGLNRTYWRLGTALHSQSIFDAALKNYDTSYNLSKQSGDSLYVFYSVITAANVCREGGDYTTSFEKLLILHSLNTDGTAAKFKGPAYRTFWADWEEQILGDLQFSFGDFNAALQYYQKKSTVDAVQLATTFANNKQFDSARKYFNAVYQRGVDTTNAFYLTFFGEYYLLLSNYNKALPNLLKSCNQQKQDSDVNQTMRLLIDIANTHLGLKNNDSALKYAREALAIANKTGAAQVKRDASKILFPIYDYWHHTDSAYFYYRQYTAINDSILSKNAKGKLEGFVFAQKIELLNKEKGVQKIQLEKQSFQKNVLIAGIAIFLLVAFLLYRNNRHKQKANIALQHQKQKVENALSELKSTQAQLVQSEKMASLGELTAGIAHEIQNPLNFVNNFSEVNKELIEELKIKNEKLKIEDDEVTELLDDITQNLEKINHHGKRADAIVKGMLQHSRTSTGQKEPTQINALADEYLRLAYHGLRAKDKSFNATTKTDFDNSVGKINIIPQDIGRVILNLINNAFYAASERQKTESLEYEPTVTVGTRKLQDKVQISVKDNGNGIPDSIKEKIFQPFFTTKPTGQGTGLGLSLGYDIIKAHGGELTVQTKEGEGSEFIIQLPGV